MAREPASYVVLIKRGHGELCLISAVPTTRILAHSEATNQILNEGQDEAYIAKIETVCVAADIETFDYEGVWE